MSESLLYLKEVNMEKLIPVTALITITIFLISQIIEGYKVHKKQKHSEKSVKLLLAYELERNFWSVKHFFHLLSELEKVHRFDEATLTLTKGIESNYSVTIEQKSGEFTGQAIPPFYHSRFDALIIQVSELGEDTYEKIQEAYSSLNELDDYRIQALNLFDGNEWLSEPQLTFAYLGDKAKSYEAFYSKLNEAYVCLTGNELKKHRLD